MTHGQVSRPDPVRHRGGAARDGNGGAKHVDGVGLRGRCVGRGHLHLNGVAAHAEVDLEAGGRGVGVRQRGVRIVEILDRRRRLACRLGDRDLAHRIRHHRAVARRGRGERRAERRAAHRQGAQRRVGGDDRVRIAIDDDAERLVGPGLKHPGTAALPVELVFDAPVRETERIFSAGGGGVELHAPGAALRDHHHVVGVRRKGEAGGVRERHVPEPGEAPRRRQGRAVAGGGGGKLVRGAILLADLDVEVVVQGVVGGDDHAGERVAGRVGTRVEQLRMFVATGVGAVIGRLHGVAHENARCLRLRRGRPEEQQAQDEDEDGGAAWTGGPQGGTAKKEHGKDTQSAREGRKRLGGLGWGGRASFARRPRPGGDDGRQLGRGGRIQAIISAPCITKMGGG